MRPEQSVVLLSVLVIAASHSDKLGKERARMLVVCGMSDAHCAY